MSRETIRKGVYLQSAFNLADTRYPMPSVPVDTRHIFTCSLFQEDHGTNQVWVTGSFFYDYGTIGAESLTNPIQVESQNYYNFVRVFQSKIDSLFNGFNCYMNPRTAQLIMQTDADPGPPAKIIIIEPANLLTKQLLGMSASMTAVTFSVDPTFGLSYVSPCTPKYIWKSSYDGATNRSMPYEASSKWTDMVGNDGTTLSLPTDGTEKWADWEFNTETRDKVFASNARPTEPWTWEHFVQDVRALKPFIVWDSSYTQYNIGEMDASFYPNRNNLENVYRFRGGSDNFQPKVQDERWQNYFDLSVNARVVKSGSNVIVNNTDLLPLPTSSFITSSNTGSVPFNGTYTGYSIGNWAAARGFRISASNPLCPDICAASTASYEGTIAVSFVTTITGGFANVVYNFPNRFNSGINGFQNYLRGVSGEFPVYGGGGHVVSGGTSNVRLSPGQLIGEPTPLNTGSVHRFVTTYKNNYVYMYMNGKLMAYRQLSDSINPPRHFVSSTLDWVINSSSTNDQVRLVALSFDGLSGRTGPEITAYENQVLNTGVFQMSGSQYHWEATDWVASGSDLWTDRIAGLQMERISIPLAFPITATLEPTFVYDPLTFYTGSIMSAYDTSRPNSIVLDGNGNVERLVDFSGNGNHLTTSTNLTSHPRVAGFEYTTGVVFDGVNDQLFCSGVNMSITGNHLMENTMTFAVYQLLSGTSSNFVFTWNDVTGSKVVYELLTSFAVGHRPYQRIRMFGSASATSIIPSVGPYTAPISGTWGAVVHTQLNLTDTATKFFSGTAPNFNLSPQAIGDVNTYLGPRTSGSIMTWGNGGSTQPGAYTSMSLAAHYTIRTTSSFRDYYNLQAWAAQKGWF